MAMQVDKSRTDHQSSGWDYLAAFRKVAWWDGASGGQNLAILNQDITNDIHSRPWVQDTSALDKNWLCHS
jgi:hypothetical protein